MRYLPTNLLFSCIFVRQNWCAHMTLIQFISTYPFLWDYRPDANFYRCSFHAHSLLTPFTPMNIFWYSYSFVFLCKSCTFRWISRRKKQNSPWQGRNKAYLSFDSFGRCVFIQNVQKLSRWLFCFRNATNSKLQSQSSPLLFTFHLVNLSSLSNKWSK